MSEMSEMAADIAFLEIFLRIGCGVDESSVLEVINDIRSHAKNKAKSGLRMAIGDCLEILPNISYEIVDKIESKLIQNGLPGIGEMEIRYSRIVKKIVSRGHIKNDEEFQIIKNLYSNEDVAVKYGDSIIDLLNNYEGV